jgi:hypothetical protein
MDHHHLAQGQPGIDRRALCVAEPDHLGQAAFKRHGTFDDARRGDPLGKRRRQAGQGEFVDMVGNHRRGGVHGQRQRPGRQVPHELARLLDIAHRVLPARAGKSDDRRLVVEGVEEAVGREIAHARGADRRDPADRSRRDDGVQRIVPQAMAGLGIVGMDRGHRRLACRGSS